MRCRRRPGPANSNAAWGVPPRGVEHQPDEFDALRLIYLPVYRDPLDELARREAQILIELFRAEQQAVRGHRNLVDLRTMARALLDALVKTGLIESVEQRVRSHLAELSSGVSHQFAFVGGQVVDDAYLARVLELLLGSIDDRALAQRLEVSGLGCVNLLHLAVTLAAIPDVVSPPQQPAAAGDGDAGTARRTPMRPSRTARRSVMRRPSRRRTPSSRIASTSRWSSRSLKHICSHSCSTA
jgi:putative ATP-dependent endonuclease of OLD family